MKTSNSDSGVNSQRIISKKLKFEFCEVRVFDIRSEMRSDSQQYFADISADSNGNFGGKTRGICDCWVCIFWKLVPVSHTKSYPANRVSFDLPRQIGKRKTKTLQKLAWCFRPKLEMLKYSRELSMIILVDIECTGYLWIFDYCGPYSMPKPREFVHNKSEILFRIASHFWTNIEYSQRVQTSFFVEIILWGVDTGVRVRLCRNI